MRMLPPQLYKRLIKFSCCSETCTNHQLAVQSWGNVVVVQTSSSGELKKKHLSEWKFKSNGLFLNAFRWCIQGDLYLSRLCCNFFWQQDVLCPWFLKAHSVRNFCGLAYLKKLCKTGCIHALLIVSLWTLKAKAGRVWKVFCMRELTKGQVPLLQLKRGDGELVCNVRPKDRCHCCCLLL